MLWTIFWGLWVVVGGGVEVYAIHRKASGDTLTEQYRLLEGLTRSRPAWLWIMHIFTAGFLAWLGLHFLVHMGA